MDPGKRRALINWWNALSEKKVQSFADLRDGVIIAKVLLTCGDNLIPSDTDLKSPQQCLFAIKGYIESFYHQSLDDGSLINFGFLVDEKVQGELLDLEVGKLLLALLGCVIQDRGRENFITPALTIDEASQSELWLIMSTICKEETETKLLHGFHNVLKQKQEPSSDPDTANFFKLVAEVCAANAIAASPGPSTPQTVHAGSAITMYTNSPGAANISNMSIRDISSPMRHMSLSSPVASLGALMSSPQLQQKAAMRKKDFEYKKLEAALRNEQHLRSEVELDLMDRSKLVEEKEMRIRELERELSGVRQVRDKLDELEELQTSNEALRKDITRLQNRLKESQDLREHNTVLQRENNEYLADLQKARDEMKMLESIQQASETYRAKCHKLQLELSETELALQHRQEENGSLQQAVEELRNMHEIASNQCKTLRGEKEELEELLGTRNVEMASSVPLGFGESMNIVTEKKLAELKVQYETMRCSWIDPHQHTTIVKELAMEKETKKTYEERYFEVRKKLMVAEDHIQKLNADLSQTKSAVTEFEANLQEMSGVRKQLESEVANLRLCEEALRKSETGLQAEVEQKQASIEALEKELSRNQTELELTQKELEVMNNSSETKRTTIMNMDQEKHQLLQTETRLSNEIKKLTAELEVYKVKGEELLQRQEEVTKLNMEKEDLTRRFDEKVENLEEEIKKMSDMLTAERKMSVEKQSNFDSRLQSEKSEREKLLQERETVQEEFEQFKASADEKERALEEKLEIAVKDKRTVDLEIHRLNLQFSSSKDSFSTKVEKLDAKFKDEAMLLNKEIEMLKNAKDECISVQGRLNEEIRKLNQIIQKQKEEIQKLNRLVENLKSANSELVESLEQAKMTVGQYDYQLKMLKEKLVEEENQSTTLKKEKTDKINSLRMQLDGNVTQYNTEKSELNQQIEKMEVELEEQKEEFTIMKAHMEGKLSTMKCDHEKVINKLKNGHEKDVENYKEKLQALTTSNEKAVEALKQIICDFEQKLKNSENIRIELEFAVKEKESMVKSMSEQTEYLKTVEKSLKSTILMLETDADTMKNLINERDGVKSELTEIVSKKNEVIKGLQEAQNSLLKSIEALQTEKAELVREQDTQVFKLNSDFSEQLAALKTDLLNSEHNMLETQESAAREIARLTAELSEKAAACDQLTEEHKVSAQEHGQIISEKKAEIEHLESELRMSSESCLVLKQQVDTLESQLNELRTAYSKLESELNTSSVNTNSVKSDLESKLSTESGLRAELESQHSVLLKEHKTTKDNLEQINNEKDLLAQNLEQLKNSYESEMSELKEKLFETEHYWKSQCEDLAEEYEQGTNEQKETMSQQLEELKTQHEAEMESLTDEKDMCIASQAQSYQERIHGLEKALAEKKEDWLKQANEMVVLEEKYNKTVEDMRVEMLKQTEVQNAAQEEIESLNSKNCQQSEDNKKEVEMLIGQYETQLEELTEQLNTEHAESMKQLEEQFTVQIDKLQSEVQEQRVNYQQMMCGMEEKLGGEAVVLRERLSQMKCQYEAMIETKEKETKTKVSDLESKVSEYKSKVSDVESTLQVSEEEKAGLSQQINVLNQELSQLQADKTELMNKNAELENVIIGMKVAQQELEQKMASMQELIDSVQSELGTMKEGAKRAYEEVSKEKGEVEELKRQLEYSRDRNDTLTAELSSQQQQLAAVEEEKRVLSVEVRHQANGHQLELQELAVQQDRHSLEVEELERQLQSSHKCYEAVQKSQTELEAEVKKGEEERSTLERRNRELEQRIYNYLEREKKLATDNQFQIDKAAELNGTVRRQLDEKCRELHSLNEQFNAKMEAMTDDFGKMKKRFEKDMQSVIEEKTALEIDAAQLKQVQEKLKASEAEAKRLHEVNTQYNIHYNKKKEIIASLEAKLRDREHEMDELRRTEQKLLDEITPIREKLDIERMKNGKLTSTIRTLEVQADLGDRKLREYKQALEKGNSVFLGDSSEFQKMLRERDNCNNASFMEKHPSSLPLNDSVFEFEKQDVEKHQAFFEDSTMRTMSDTLTPNSRSSRSRKKMGKSASSSTVTSSEKDADKVSIGSATSLAYRLRSRESAVSLNRSYTSLNSCRSNASVPRGTGGIFHCEDEPMEFEWGRLGELQRRNTLCPAHLKTSYPVETQTYKPNRFQEDALRESTMGNQTIQDQVTGSGRKRKQLWESTSDGSDDSDNKNKQPKMGCQYHKPGPPTPANQRRNSGKGSRSPGSRTSKGSKSPRTPYSLRSKRTPKRTPKHTPKRTAMADNRENTSSAKKVSQRDSVSFNIGFSPQSSVSSISSKQLRRQHAFVQKQPQSSVQTRKPLGTRNILQTGV